MTHDHSIYRAEWLPTPTQELLLKACLAHGSESITLWNEWKSRIDLNDADAGSQRLLPHLFRKLTSEGCADADLEKYKGIYRMFWYKNQMLFNIGAEMLGRLHERGMRTMLLKGAVLSSAYYGTFGLRPMSDIDILVETGRALEALEVVQRAGFVPNPQIRLRYSTACVQIIHGFGFVNANNHGIDLHWHLLPEACQRDADTEFWKAAEPFEFNGVHTHALSPTDLLFQVLVAGARWELIPTIRWVVDAMLVLNRTQVDWNRIVAHAQQHHLVLPVRNALRYLQDSFHAGIPDRVLAMLDQLPTLRIEHREFNYKTKNYERRLLGHLPLHWYGYRRLNRFSVAAALPIGFLRYLQQYWGLEHFWQMPLYALKLARLRVKKAVPSEQIAYTLPEFSTEQSREHRA